MGLTDDQKAMLRLLAQREEGYDDMAALMGISVEEVRERVKEALAEVEEPPAVEEEPVAPAPTPPAEAPAAAAPAAATPAEPATPPPATETPPAPEQSTRTAPSKRRPAQIPSLKVPKDRGALIGLGAGALVVIALVIVLIVGGDGGGSSSSGTTSGEASLAESKNLTQAILSADDGSDASGQAIFGRFKKKVLLQVTGEGLEPSNDGESYAVWLSHSGQAMVPVGTVKVKDSGQLAARFEVPPTVLVLVARGAFDEIEVTRTSDAQLSAAIAAARKTQKESAYTGTPVLSGKITGPLVGAGGK